MHIYCLGINHRTADVCLRERLAFSSDKAKAALSRLGCGLDCEASELIELVILSTCNRVELYAVTQEENFTALEQFLVEVQDLSLEELQSHLYCLSDAEAVNHLFRVAAGLDSLVLGEPQILGQVMDAFELARSQGAAGPVLTRLFQAALHTGKRARTETAISHSPASIASVAIHLAERSVPDLAGARVAVVGAGEMAELAVESLRKRGVSHIQVINRTLDRAQRLASRWGGEASTFERIPEALQWSDILVASTGAPHTLIHPEMVLQALSGRGERPLVIIDIAVPRDVDMEIGSLPGVSLYDIDALNLNLEEALSRRAREVPRVEAILVEEEEAFIKYLEALDIFPIIAEMRQRAESIRMAELEKTLRRMNDLSPEDRKRLEALTEALVKKILHTPITRLKAEAGTPYAAHYAAAARNLFGLDQAYPS